MVMDLRNEQVGNCRWLFLGVLRVAPSPNSQNTAAYTNKQAQLRMAND